MKVDDSEVLQSALKKIETPGVFKGVDEIIAIALKKDLTFKEIAQICNVSINSVFRWNRKNEKGVSKAKSDKIKPLIMYLSYDLGLIKEYVPPSDKYNEGKMLSEATLEDLRDRANQLGFRVTFIEI